MAKTERASDSAGSIQDSAAGNGGKLSGTKPGAFKPAASLSERSQGGSNSKGRGGRPAKMSIPAGSQAVSLVAKSELAAVKDARISGSKGQRAGSAVASRVAEDPLDRVQERLGHTFKDRALLERAFTHASGSESRQDSNERLEFLGDAVLGLVTCELIFRLYPSALEGDMTKIKSSVVSRQTCAQICLQLGLDELLRLGKGMKRAGAGLSASPVGVRGGDVGVGSGSLPQSLAAATLEAVIAAIYLDAGLKKARDFLIPLLTPAIHRNASSGHQENFKSVLQQHAQTAYSAAPLYHILDEKGPDHAKCFEVAVEIAGRRFASTWGSTKKQAEQQAALSALQELGLVMTHEDGGLRVVPQG